jgi:hypothetical protein
MTQYEIKIYKIWYTDNPTDFYIGSTKHIKKRMQDHKKNVQKGRKSKLYQMIREKGNNFNYTILETYMVSNHEQKIIFEQEWMDKLNPTLNMTRAHGIDIERSKNKNKSYENLPNRIKYRKEYKNTIEYKNRKKELYNDKKRQCICGRIYSNTPSCSKAHYNTKIHIKFVNQFMYQFKIDYLVG